MMRHIAAWSVRSVIRELRQSASVHLRKVSAGEEIVVTDRGRPVARLVAASVAEQRLAEKLAAHALLPPSRPRRRFSTTHRLAGDSLSASVAAGREDRDIFSA